MILIIESEEVLVSDGVVLVFELALCLGDIEIALPEIGCSTHMDDAVAMCGV